MFILHILSTETEHIKYVLICDNYDEIIPYQCSFVICVSDLNVIVVNLHALSKGILRGGMVRGDAACFLLRGPGGPQDPITAAPSCPHSPSGPPAFDSPLT